MNVRLMFSSTVATFLIASAAALAEPPLIPSNSMTPPPISPRTTSGYANDNGFTFTIPLELKNLAADDARDLSVACAISTGSDTRIVEDRAGSATGYVHFSASIQPDGNAGSVVGQSHTAVPLQNGSFAGSVTVAIARPATPAHSYVCVLLHQNAGGGPPVAIDNTRARGSAGLGAPMYSSFSITAHGTIH